MVNIHWREGFTIVELLIVIVVIAILAAISVVAYTAVQGRAQDSRRFSDMRAIAQALERYKIDKGYYPPVLPSGMGQQAGWESSAREEAEEFISFLKSYGFSGGVPVDPVNNAIEDSVNEARANGSFGYNYHRYAAGYGGCDSSRGAFYVLGIISTSESGTSPHASSPGFACSRNWQSDYAWVIGGFER